MRPELETTGAAPAGDAALELHRLETENRKLHGLLGALGALLARSGFTIEKRRLTAEAFYRDYFFAARPVVVQGLMNDWPARTEWAPRRLRERFGDVEVEITSGREGNARYDEQYRQHRATMALGEYLDRIVRERSNDLYLVARNNALRHERLQPLWNDFAAPPGFLDPQSVLVPNTKLWIGPAGTITPLHHDGSSLFFAQVQGCKRFKLIPPYFSAALYNTRTVYSDVDLAAIDYERFPLMRGVPVFETVVEPGDFLLIPVGWWHWVESLEPSVSLTFRNFYFHGPVITWENAVLE